MTTTTLTGDLLIGGRDVRGTEGEIRGTDPRTGEELEPGYGLAGSADVGAAAALAWEAFGTYRATTLSARADFLDRVAVEIEAVAEPLVSRTITETGIPEARVKGELARTVNQLRMFGKVLREGSYLGARIDPAIPDRTPLPRPDLRQRKVPLGPVAVFSASNFPLAFSVAGGDTASALAAGCPVIVKAHSAHPGVSEIVGRAVREAVRASGMPEGTFSLLHGSGRGMGTELVTHPHVRAVGFTGSRTAGLALGSAAAGRPVPIPVYAEMSSINPVFVLPDALATRGETIGRELVASMTTGIGQLCTSPGIVFVVGDDGREALEAAAGAALAEASNGPMLTSGMASSFNAGVERLESIPAVEVLARGVEAHEIAASGRSAIFATDIETFLADPSLQEEVFGASTILVRTRDVDEAITAVQALEGQLTATVHAEPSDHAAAARLLPELEALAGRILFGGWPTGVEVGHAVVHGGPFPATSAPATTSVGSRAIERFLRPVSYQNLPQELLPAELVDGNPLGLWRRVDGELTQD